MFIAYPDVSVLVPMLVSGVYCSSNVAIACVYCLSNVSVACLMCLLHVCSVGGLCKMSIACLLVSFAKLLPLALIYCLILVPHLTNRYANDDADYDNTND